MRGRGLMFFHLEGFLRSIYKVKKIETRLVGLVGQKMIEATSNSFYVVFGPLLAPIPNFVHIGWKAHKLKRGIQLASPLFTAHSKSDFVFTNDGHKRAVFLFIRWTKSSNVFWIKKARRPQMVWFESKFDVFYEPYRALALTIIKKFYKGMKGSP